MDEKDKRPRTGPSDDSGGEASISSTSGQNPQRDSSPPRYTPAAALGLSGANNNPSHATSIPLPTLPAVQRRGPGGRVGFSAPLTAGSLSGLVQYIAPTLSDGEGSASSESGQESSSYHPSRPAPRHAQQQQHQRPHVTMSFLGGNSPTRTLPAASNPCNVNASAMDQTTETVAGATAVAAANAGGARRSSDRTTPPPWPFVGGTGSVIAPAAAAPNLPVDLLRAAQGIEDESAVGSGASVPTTSMFGLDSQSHHQRATREGTWREDEADGPRAFSRAVPPQRPLPMTPLPLRARAHLSTFLRSVSSLLPLPGTGAMREALARWDAAAACAGGQDLDQDQEKQKSSSLGADVDEDATAVAFSSAHDGKRAQHQQQKTTQGGDLLNDPMDEADEGEPEDELPRTEGKTVFGPAVQEKQRPGGGGDEGGGSRDDRCGLAGPVRSRPRVGPSSGDSAGGLASQRVDDKGGDNDDTDGLEFEGEEDAELGAARRAETWAAVAVGALFSGAGEKEAEAYTSRSLRALSNCLDAPLPEVRWLLANLVKNA